MEKKKRAPRDNRKWLPLESAAVLNFNNLITKVKKNLMTRYPDIKGEDFIELIHKSLDTFKINDQSFEFSPIMNGYGIIWYALCPRCKRTSTKLYLPLKARDRENLYLCRSCHKLKHASLLLAKSKRYTKVIKPLKQLEKLRAQLLKRTNSNEKTRELLDQYEMLERELAASPEYRLWKFQKEHGVKL
jgi:hypothetical protein